MKRRTVTSLISAALVIIAVALAGALTIVPAANANSEAVSEGDKNGHSSAAGNKGFITTSLNQKYFQFSNGMPFVPVGHNDTFDLKLIFDEARLDRYLAHMSANGENVLRVLLDGWGNNLIELKVGEFNPDIERGMNNLVSAAEKHGIYLIVSLWISINEFSFVPGIPTAWSNHPYNVKQDGGLVESGLELLTHPAAIAAQKNRMFYFIEKWGSSPNIFAWELWNELDAMREGQRSNSMDTLHEQNLWIDEIGAFAREAELMLFGRHHLRTASVSNAGWGSELSGIYTAAELDFTSYHTYDFHLMVGVNPWTGETGKSPLDPVKYFEFTYESARLAVDKSGFRPVLGTEDVMITPRDSKPVAFQGFTQDQLDDIFTGTIWTSILGGGAGGNLRWTDPGYGEHSDPDGFRGLSNGMYDAQKAMSTILSKLNWGQFYSDYANDSVVPIGNEVDVSVKALSDRNNMLFLLMDRDSEFNRRPARSSVRFQNLNDGRYRVTWYEVRTGEILQVDSAYGPSFTLRTPEFGTFVVGVVSGRFAVGRENHAPKAKILSAEYVLPGTSVLLNGVLSTDVDGDPITYQWEQVSGPKVLLTESGKAGRTESKMEFLPEVEDSYVFALKVFDGKIWSNLDYANVKVTNELPLGCSVVFDGRNVKAGMNRSDLLFVVMLFLPALAVGSHWKRKIKKS